MSKNKSRPDNVNLSYEIQGDVVIYYWSDQKYKKCMTETVSPWYNRLYNILNWTFNPKFYKTNKPNICECVKRLFTSTYTYDSWNVKQKSMDLVKFQNYGLMKTPPWVWNNSSVEENDKYHKQFKERLDKFYIENH